MKKNIGIVLLIIGLIIAFILAKPLFVDDVVNEDFPGSTSSSSSVMKDVDSMVELPDQETLDSMSDETKASLEKSILDKMKDMPATMVEEEMMDKAMGPELQVKGSFVDADSFHKGSGDALVYRLEDGSNLLRLENFNVTNGPDLFVYLVKDVNNVEADFVNVGRLKGNQGNQNYELSSEINIDEYQGVVIWCKAFSVLFSTAVLK